MSGAGLSDLFRLSQGDCGGDYDVLYAASPRKVGDRTGETLEDRTVGLGAGESLSQFVPDVSCLEVGEDKNICLSGDG